MENILKEVGLKDKIQVFRRQSITLKHFQTIMTPNVSSTHREIVMESTGLKLGQILDICNHIENKFGKKFITMKIVTPNLTNKQFPRGNNLSSTYGRSNRISKLVAPLPTKAPLKNLDGFLGLNKEEVAKEKPEQEEEIPQPAPVKEVQEEVQAPQILEAREEAPKLQHLNEHSQEYVIKKLENLAQKTENEDMQMEREFYPRKLSSPADYEESNLSKEFEVEKPKDQFDIEEDEDSHHAAVVDEAAEMMRKAEEAAKQTNHLTAMAE